MNTVKGGFWNGFPAVQGGEEMYTVIDTFNHGTISRHRTLGAAIKAETRYRKALARQGCSASTAVFDEDGNMLNPDHPRTDEYWDALEATNA